MNIIDMKCQNVLVLVFPPFALMTAVLELHKFVKKPDNHVNPLYISQKGINIS